MVKMSALDEAGSWKLIDETYSVSCLKNNPLINPSYHITLPVTSLVHIIDYCDYNELNKQNLVSQMTKIYHKVHEKLPTEGLYHEEM